MKVKVKMMWILLALVMYCLPTVESEECQNTVVGRLGKELVFNFSLPDLRDEYNEYIKNVYVQGINERLIQTQDLKKGSIEFKHKKDSLIEKPIYKNGNLIDLADSRTELVINNDVIMVTKRKLQKEDAGIYFMEFKFKPLGQKVLIITDKPTIIGRSPPNPVLKPEDNCTSSIQLECDSVSTSIGDCQPSLYIVWYKNGMRMTDVDPTLSQINVTVDHNGGNFTCLVTDYPPCYQRLQTTKYYDAVTIEECNNVSESETFIIKPQFEPMDVKLEPDQREITVNINKNLKVRCSAKCHPKCDVRWEKDYQDFESNGLVNLTENSFEKDLVIKNVNSSYEGVYVCLVSNIHGEVKKGFTLGVRETKDKSFIYAEMNNVIVAVTAVIVIVIVVIVIVYKKNRKRKKEILRSLEMRKMSEEWKRIVREPKMIKVETTEAEVACRTMDLKQDTPLPESKDEAWQKWMTKPWDIGAWKKMLGSFETSKLKTAKGEVSLETMDVHHDKLLPESQGEGICVTTETH